jgi:hypothetical protein
VTASQSGGSKRSREVSTKRAVGARRRADHRRRDVDPQHGVAGIGEHPRPDAAAAAQVDHQPIADAGAAQQAQQAGRDPRREAAEPSVVDIGEVLSVGFRRHDGLRSWLPVGCAHRHLAASPRPHS